MEGRGTRARATARSAIGIAIVLCVGLLSTSACSKAPDVATPATAPPSTVDTAEPVAGGSVVYGIGDESTGWLPASDRWGPGPINMARAMMDPLVVTGDDLQLHPWLAESFTPQEGNTTWLIRVRPGISFQNGEPVDAHALVANLDAFKKSALSAFAFKPVTAVQQVDEATVKVTLDQAWANFPTLFTGQVGFIVAPDQLARDDHEKPIGSGPFVFESWRRDSELVVKKNPNYWRTDTKGRKLPYLDQVTFRPTPDESARLASLESGNIDLMGVGSARNAAKLVRGDLPAHTKVLVDESQGDELSVIFNTQTGPAADERLRKAVQYATDRPALLAQYDDAFDPADGPFSEKSPFWSPSGQPDHDLAKAKELVAQYQQDHPGPVKITLTIGAAPDALESGQLLQSQWAEAGIETELQAQEVTKFSSTLVGGGFQAILFGYWGGEDPDVNYVFWTGKNIGPEGSLSLNFPRWSSPEVDKALDDGRAETDPAKRKAIYATVWKAWADHATAMFLFHAKSLLLYRDHIHGIDAVNLPDGKGKQQKISGGTVNLSNTWTEKR